MDSDEVQQLSLEEMGEKAQKFKAETNEQAETNMELLKETKKVTTKAKQAETQFLKSLKSFQAEQEKIIKDAQLLLPVQCVKCSTYIHSKKDRGSAAQTGSCFTCYTKEKEAETFSAESKIKKAQYDLISTMDLSDYEEWLFDDEMGKRCLARIIAKTKAQGYDYKPWQISIAAAAWSKDNYNQTSLEDTRYIVERVRIKELINYIPVSPDNISSVIDSIKRAEEIRNKNNPVVEKDNKHWMIIGGIAGVSVLIPYLFKKR